MSEPWCDDYNFLWDVLDPLEDVDFDFDEDEIDDEGF